MKYKLLAFIAFVSFQLFAQNKNQTIGFTENKGQIIDQKGKPNPAVKFLLNSSGLNVQLRKNGFSYDVYETKKHPLTENQKKKQDPTAFPNKDKDKFPEYTLEYIYHRIDIDFVDSNRNVELIKEGESTDYDNYYNVIGKPEGVINVHKFKQLTYKNIYPNIDVVFSIPKDSLKTVEYNFVVHPGGKTSDIKLKFNGAQTDLVDNKIKMQVRFGEMEETLPMSWIENGNEKKEIAIGYRKIKKNVYGFESAEIISNKTLIIDPVPIRLWGTYYGKGTNYQLLGLENDNLSNVFLCGTTSDSSNIATVGSFMPTINLFSDAFIVKFDLNGKRLWGTYYGGNNGDAFDSVNYYNAELILSGTTRSTNNISTPGAFKEDKTPGGFAVSDVFITKFNTNGIRIWGTYYGGEHDEYCTKSVVDNYGNIILVGSTYSKNNIATSGTFKDSKKLPIDYHTTGEGFIAKFNNSGFQIWGSYYNLCDIWGLDIDSNSNIFFSGDVSRGTDNITTPGTHQPTFNYNTGTGVANYESFIVKFNPDGQRLWGTYYGNAWENNHCLKIDHSDNIVISGFTRSKILISTVNSYQPNLNTNVQNPSDAYLAKFNQNGQLIWGTYYGGDDQEDLDRYTIDIDENNNIFLAGNTFSTNNISTLDAYNYLSNGWYDNFIVKFNSSGSRIWGTYFGGNNGDFTTSIKYNKQGVFYLTGNTSSINNIGTPNSNQESISADRAYFLVKFKDCSSTAKISSISPICIGSSLELKASGGTNYAWTGPNGFTATDQNPTIPNASALNAGKYSCTITGTGGCDGDVSIDVLVEDKTPPVPNLATLLPITGDCNTIITTIPTATDACAGAITATTTSPLSYSLPGTYTIVWDYDDGNSNISHQNQTVTISNQPLPTATSPQTFCIQKNTTLSSVVITGTNIKWYDALTNGNLLANTTFLQNEITYYASQTINGCESERIPILINIQNSQAPAGNASQSFCTGQNPTLSAIAVTGTDIKWYDNTGLFLLDTTPLADSSTYFATQTLNQCESQNKLVVTVSLINSLPANGFEDSFCDDLNDGLETINLSDYNSKIISNTTNYNFAYYNSRSGAENQLQSDIIIDFGNYKLPLGENKIYVRINSTTQCYGIAELKLSLFYMPLIPIKNTVPICQNNSILVSAGNNHNSYIWSTGKTASSIIITTEGQYWVEVVDNHGTLTCTNRKEFSVVLSNKASISHIDTIDWTDNENIITVFATGNGNYEYSIDGVNYQDSNQFLGLNKGKYTIYVRDKNGCGTVKEEVFLLMYPKFFTPNGDGYNDTWKIKFSENEPSLKIEIFDRYGKLIKGLLKNNLEWDGTLNNYELPATDYWFVVTRANGKVYKGHFSLKR